MPWSDEKVHLHAYETVSAAREGIRRFINFYDARRPHSSHQAPTSAVVYFASLPCLRPKQPNPAEPTLQSLGICSDQCGQLFWLSPRIGIVRQCRNCTQKFIDGDQVLLGLFAKDQPRHDLQQLARRLFWIVASADGFQKRFQRPARRPPRVVRGVSPPAAGSPERPA